MKISYNWLSTYVNSGLSPDDVAEKLTLTGLEVEELTPFGSDLSGCVVGHVLDVRPHPDADRLRVCDVNIGDSQVQIVCGADNVAKGQKVPVATLGAVLPVSLPDGSAFKIKKAKLRGVESEGMICAEDELGLGDNHDGIMVLDDTLKPGTPLQKALNIETDTIFEIGLTPNRPDAACHIGTARDLAAVTGKPLDNPYNFKPVKSDPLNNKITIRIDDSEKCHRYAAKIVENVTIGPSPAWLQNRLRSIGLRPVNNVVDVTNFILHEIGQPLHAFDYDLLAGQEIVVRSFDKKTKFTTLDDTERDVPADTLFICDGQKPIAIAGIMGGVNSEVSAATKTVLIESAWFEPTAIRRASKRLTLQTDASYRFERGIDPNVTRKAAEKAAQMIAELAGGTILKGCTDIHPVKTEPRQVDLRISRVNQLLGTDITLSEASDILSGLEIVNSRKGDDLLQCFVPTFRPDITREVDLVEEVGRIYDYNRIPDPQTVPFYTPPPLSARELFDNRLKTVATRLRYKEITTNSLLSQKEASLFREDSELIRTLNPVSNEATTLRPSLTCGFLKACQYNLNRNARQLRFFEVGHVYHRGEPGNWVPGIREETHLLLGLCGVGRPENWQSEETMASLFDLKADLDALFQQLGVTPVVTSSDDQSELIYSLSTSENRTSENRIAGNKTAQEKTEDVKPAANDELVQIAWIRPVSQELAGAFDITLPATIAEINLSRLFELSQSNTAITYQPVSKYPPFSFDAAFTVDSAVTAGQLSHLIHQSAGPVLDNLDVFDVYEGENIEEGKKSIAFRLTFSDRNKTLTIKDVEPVVNTISKVLASETGARLRS